MYISFSTLVVLATAILGVTADVNAEAARKKPDTFAGLTKGKTFVCDDGFWHRCCKGEPSYSVDPLTIWATSTCDAAQREHIGTWIAPKMGNPHCYSDRQALCCTAMKPAAWSKETQNLDPLICGPARFF